MGKTAKTAKGAGGDGTIKGAGKSLKAGLVLPIARVNRKLKKRMPRVGQGAPVYLTAVLEYVSGEIIELALKHANSRKVKRITATDLSYAVRSDKELNKLFESYSMFSGDKMEDIMEEVTTEADMKDKKKQKEERKRKAALEKEGA